MLNRCGQNSGTHLAANRFNKSTFTPNFPATPRSYKKTSLKLASETIYQLTHHNFSYQITNFTCSLVFRMGGFHNLQQQKCQRVRPVGCLWRNVGCQMSRTREWRDKKNGINCSNYCAYSGFLVFKCNGCRWCKFCTASGHSRVCLTPELWTWLEDIVDIL